MSEWLPIETAPKDGTRIMIADHRGGVWFAKWDNEIFDTQNDRRAKGWLIFDPEDSWYVVYSPAEETTHWQPVPESPK